MVNTILKKNPDYKDSFHLPSTIPHEHEGDQQGFISHGSSETLRNSNANLPFCVSADGMMNSTFARKLRKEE